MYENKDKKIGGFSGGMKQRIGIAQTLLNLPRILVVDEPTAGLDPREESVSETCSWNCPETGS